jgi:hypothetical protein
MNLIPIYRSDGEWVALLEGRSLYDTMGDWIGWLEGREVFSRDGEYAGYLSDDQRILRRRARQRRPLRTPPPPPPAIRVPAKVPLAPLFAEIPWEVVDVFEEEPHIFRYVSEFKPDWGG